MYFSFGRMPASGLARAGRTRTCGAGGDDALVNGPVQRQSASSLHIGVGTPSDE